MKAYLIILAFGFAFNLFIHFAYLCSGDYPRRRMDYESRHDAIGLLVAIIWLIWTIWLLICL